MRMIRSKGVWNFIRAILLIIGSILLFPEMVYAQDSLNVRWLGGWTFGEAEHLSVCEIDGHKYCFLTAGCGVFIIDVTDPYNPYKVSQIYAQAPHPRSDFADNLLFLAESELGLFIYDVSVPSSPVYLSHCSADYSVSAVRVRNHYAYILDGPKMRVIDCSDPYTPNEIGSCEPSEPVDWCCLTLRGDYAYCTGFGYHLTVINITDAVNPYVCFDTIGCTNSFDIKTAGDLLFIQGWNGPICIYDLTVPSHPVSCGEIEYTTGMAVEAYDTLVFAAYKDIPNQLYYFGIWDVSDTANIVQIGSMPIPGYGGNGIEYMDGYVYFSHGPGGLRIIDVADPTNPNETGVYETPGYGVCLYVKDNYAYYVGNQLLTIVDVSDPRHCIDLGTWSIPQQAKINEIYLQGQFLYATDDSGGMSIIDVSDPYNPVQTGYFFQPQSYYGAFGVWVKDTFAYVSYHDLSLGLRVINVADPYNPYEVGACTGGVHCSHNIVGSGNYIYMVSDKLYIVNIADPTNPYLETYLDRWGGRASLVNDRLFFTNWDSLYVVNVSDPSNPYLVRNYPIKSRDVYAADNNYVYLTVLGYYTVRIFDFSGVSAWPIELGYYNDIPHGSPGERIFYANDYIYVCQWYGGLHIYEYYGGAGVDEQETDNEGSRLRVISTDRGIEVVYYLDIDCPVELLIMDVVGRVVWKEKEFKASGFHKRMITRENFSSGVYFLVVRTQNWLDSRKVVIIK